MNEYNLNSNNIYKKEKRIMIVYSDYNVITRFLYELTKVKITTDVFKDPVLALSIFVVQDYDLLLLETRLSKMSGFKFSSLITKIKNVQVCYITAMQSYYESLREFYPNIHSSCFISPTAPSNTFTTKILDKMYNPNTF